MREKQSVIPESVKSLRKNEDQDMPSFFEESPQHINKKPQKVWKLGDLAKRVEKLKSYFNRLTPHAVPPKSLYMAAVDWKRNGLSPSRTGPLFTLSLA